MSKLLLLVLDSSSIIVDKKVLVFFVQILGRTWILSPITLEQSQTVVLKQSEQLHSDVESFLGPLRSFPKLLAMKMMLRISPPPARPKDM